MFGMAEVSLAMKLLTSAKAKAKAGQWTQWETAMDNF